VLGSGHVEPCSMYAVSSALISVCGYFAQVALLPVMQRQVFTIDVCCLVHV
jgi:hypothetical protein